MPRTQAVEITEEMRQRAREIREKLKDRPGLDEITTAAEAANEVFSGDYHELQKFLFAFRKAREAVPLTSAEAAARAGVAPDELAALESGNATNPSFRTLANLARAVGLRLTLST